MKLIKRSAPPSPYIGLFRCTHCGSELELEQSDLAGALELVDNYQGVSVRIHYPVCEEVRWLQKREAT